MLPDYPQFLKTIPLDWGHVPKKIKEKNFCIISIGKSASFMFDKFNLSHPEFKKCSGIIILPFNSEIPKYRVNTEIVFSTHPEITPFSFSTFEKLNNFILRHKPDHIIVLISGGSSALIEKSNDSDKLSRLNSDLLKSGLPITEINRIRIDNSLIKGGKLAEMFPDIFWSVFVMSDIPYTSGEYLVGSMPFYRKNLKNTELFKIADSDSLHNELLKIFNKNLFFQLRHFGGTVDELAEIIIGKITENKENILITGEPVLKINSKNPGKGGRMTHLAVKILPYLKKTHRFYALSSDGMDGNSGFAGSVIENPEKVPDKNSIDRALETYDSGTFLSNSGMCVKTGYTGINLNDFVIFLRL